MTKTMGTKMTIEVPPRKKMVFIIEYRVFMFCLLLSCLVMIAAGQDKTKKIEVDNPCYQEALVRDAIINEADQKHLNTWIVELVGSTYTRYREFRKRFANGIGEGDIFARSALEETIRSISKMKSVYPITMSDVKVRKATHPGWNVETINIIFCVRQKPEHHWLLF